MWRCIVVLLCGLIIRSAQAQNAPSSYVNPFVGTGGHGHTFPGPVLPFGMVQLGPDTRNDGSWDGCSGYHYSDSVMYGFSHTHLSGTGCSDYGDILLMPTMKKPDWDRGVLAVRFSHKNEKAAAGYYSVRFNDDPVLAELTTTTRVGFHKYTFLEEGSASIYLDLTHRDKLLEGEIKIVDEKTIEVYRRSEAWAKDQSVYARIEFSKAVKADKNAKGDKAYFTFPVKKGETVLIKVALSGVDYEGAKKNMLAELPHWDFEKTRKDAAAAWDKELSKIEVKTKNIVYLQNFYTALYHCMIHPSINSDVDKRYRGSDLKIHQADHDHYTVFSLWDTFRALHPLFTLIEQERTNDFIRTFEDIYKESGSLPVWELSGNETNCMIGYHSASVIADALLKGIGKYDTALLFDALLKESVSSRAGINQYVQKGYLSSEEEPESVSKTLEYAYDDWCIAQIAKLLNKRNEYNRYMKRSQSWVNLYDPLTGFMRPRFNGEWYTPFDPFEVNNQYTEANSWQYSFFVPQNIAALIQAHGGEKKLEEKLDQLFSADSKTTGREQADITGLIGQYAQGNEPSHHMAYLYNYVHAPYKTEKMIWKILQEMYRSAPDGLCGNEDCGQMSAWYVFSSMGFYPVTPGMPQYSIGTCLFDEVRIHPENGATFTIKTSRKSPSDFYVQSVSMDNNQFQSLLTFVQHADILRGGMLQMNLSADTSGSQFGKGKHPLGAYQKLLPAPVIQADMIFKDSSQVKISTTDPAGKLFYSRNKGAYTLYEKPFSVKSNCELVAFVKRGNDTSSSAEATLYKMKHPEWKISYNYKYNRQYSGGGDGALADGIRGDANWRKGFWQGFQGEDVEVTIDLGKEISASGFSVSLLQETRSWIVYPKKVAFSGSSDGKTYNLLGEVLNTVPADSMDAQTQSLQLVIKQSVKLRYLKVFLKQYGKLPEWHPGKGGDSFIFADEIDVH
jgi:predicted alpha-1,2-mannosidase